MIIIYGLSLDLDFFFTMDILLYWFGGEIEDVRGAVEVKVQFGWKEKGMESLCRIKVV